MACAASAALGWAEFTQADETPTAAELDWRPRAELPEEVRRTLPPFCEGGYLPSGADAAGGGLAAPGPDSDQPVEISSDYARYEMDSELLLTGDVHLRQGLFSVKTREATYDQQAGRFTLTGPMVSRGRGVLLTGAQADYDVDAGSLDVNTASFLLHEQELRGTAGHLSRPAADQLSIRQGSLTTCAPGSNDWALVASEIHLDRAEGVGRVKNLRLEVKDVPVFYWPWASFPIDDRRKSGFLYPAFGTSNTGSGGFLAVPYYFNLAPHYDATLTPQYIGGRGLFTELEGRYLSRSGESVLQLGYIGSDQDFQDESGDDDGERWGLNFESQATFTERWQASADYAVISDNDYLSDLNRGLDIDRETHLFRQGEVQYLDDRQFFQASLTGYQTITDRIAERERPYDQLPDLRYGVQHEWGLLESGLESQYTFFHRDNDDLTGLDQANGHRFRALPELALGLRSVWGYSRPSVTLDYTRYELEDFSGDSTSFDRTVPVFEWDNGLFFDRQSTLFEVPYSQTLEPRLYYAWADADSQDDIPDFDSAVRTFSFDELFVRNRFSGGDRVGDTNRLTAAVTSRFNDMNTGAERAVFSLGQIYYYDDREVSLAGEGADDRGDSELAYEAVLRPLDTLDLRTDGLWDPRASETSQARTQLVFHSADYRYLANVGHTYRRKEFEQTDIGAVFPVTDRVSLVGRWVYDARNDETVGSLAGIEYNDCCWSVQLLSQSYLTEDEGLENRVLFQIELKGLGGAGGASRRISDAIPGFEERERRRFGPGY
ncbi:LPS assembly protein LptD [Marinobacter sp.]